VPQLSVNLDLVAALRELRGLKEPDPAQAAVLAELAQADGIAIQFRRDRRHIRERDIYLLKGVVKTKLTIEMPPVEDYIKKALEIKPWLVTFVADHADSSTPVSTIDFDAAPVDFSDVANQFAGVGVNIAYFVEPEPDAVKGAARSGATAVLINCHGYTAARTLEEAQSELDRIDRAVQAAHKSDLVVNCGRGISYRNMRPLMELGLIDEFVVGHAICVRAMLVGFERAVREMMDILTLPITAQ
jgi:pyridoxine 5-phosphate synthase